MVQITDYWSLVGQSFSEKLPRRTAVVVKHDDWDLPFAYPADFGRIGWLLDSRKASSYKENPVLSLSFAEYTYADKPWANLDKSVIFFGNMSYHPSVVTREVNFANMGLKVDETLCQADGGGFVWDLNCTGLNHPHSPVDRKIFTIVTVTDPDCKVTISDGLVEVAYEGDNTQTMTVLKSAMKSATPSMGGRVYIASDFEAAAAYPCIDDFLKEAESGSIRTGGSGRHIVLQHDVKLGRCESRRLRFGVSFRSAEDARKASTDLPPVQAIKDSWNSWFASLPALNTDNERELRAYYKCWMVARLNSYEHERWGKTMIEALPVYRGYWQWALDAHEIASDLNPELGSQWIKNLLDMFIEYQREDGYITHAIYLSEKVPGEGWAKKSIVQTPHVPWVAMRYYNKTGDTASLASWYPNLKKYYEYLCNSRDRNFMNLHLWAIITSFDTGLDTTAVFEKVTYGENGVQEKFCYPSIFAAERARYEQAMARMAAVLDNGEESFWTEQAELTCKAMNEHLWDAEKKWYGVIHEDGTLDTRVGVDGLFALAYNLVDPAIASEVKDNFVSLIGKYGVHTVAPGEEGYYEDIYWRGPVWPKAISMAAAGAKNYFPDLVDSIRDGAVNFALLYPSIWECMNVDTGVIARGDEGMLATPVISSNVGSCELIGVFLLLRGERMFTF